MSSELVKSLKLSTSVEVSMSVDLAKSQELTKILELAKSEVEVFANEYQFPRPQTSHTSNFTSSPQAEIDSLGDEN